MSDATPATENPVLEAQRARMAHARAHIGKKAKEHPDMPEPVTETEQSLTPEQEQMQWSAEAQRIAAATIESSAKEAAATMSAFENPAGVKDDVPLPTPPPCPSHRTFRIDAAGLLACELCGQPPAAAVPPPEISNMPAALDYVSERLAAQRAKNSVINPCRCGHAQADHGIRPGYREPACTAMVEVTKGKCACGQYQPAPRIVQPPPAPVVGPTPAVVAPPSAAAGLSPDTERAAHIATLHLLSLVLDHTRIKAPIGFVADRCQGCMEAHGTVSRDRPCQDAKHHLEREQKRLGL